MAESAKPDWAFWLKLRSMKLWQAVALTFDVDPYSLRNGIISNIEQRWAFDKAIVLAVDACDYAEGPIWPKKPTFGMDKRMCDVKLRDVAAYAIVCKWWADIPEPILALAQAPMVAPEPDTKPPAAPIEPVPVADAPASEPLTNWRHRIQAEAWEHWLRLRASGCNPSVHSICDHMAEWCIAQNIIGGKNQHPRAGTIRNAVLGAGHWKPPHHSVAAAQEYIAQIAQTAQTEVAQIAQ